jgi:hypothetical protein
VLDVIDHDADLDVAGATVGEIVEARLRLLIDVALGLRVKLLQHVPCLSPRQVVEVALALHLGTHVDATEVAVN